MKIKKIIIIIVLILAAFILLPPLIYRAGVSLSNKINGSIVSGGETRGFLIHLPRSYSGKTAVPLVLCFHGFAEWPAHNMETSGWNKVADREVFIVVYPEGTGFPKRWRLFSKKIDGKSTGPQKEYTFIENLIKHLSAKYKIDQKRIYVNGLSNGGGMSYMISSMMPDRIAAMAGVAGAYSYKEKSDEIKRPVPVMIFHGTADEIVPYHGVKRENYSLPDIEKFTYQQSKSNNCSKKQTFQVTDNVLKTEYSSCIGNASVVLYTITGGGHSWPGGKPLPEFIVGKTSSEINATELIWKFFTGFSL